MSALPRYRYAIADLATNKVIADVRLGDVKFSRPLNDSGRFDATWKLGAHTRRLDAYDLTMPCRRCIYAYRDDRPMWGGIIWTRRYDSTTQTVQIGAGDWWSYFDHRKILPLMPPDPDLFDVAGLTTEYDQVDQNQLARQLVAQAQAHTGGDIGIELDDTTSGEPRDRTYPGYALDDVGEALRQLVNVDGGQDLVFDVAPNPAGGAPRRVLRQGTPWLGQQGSSHVWTVGGNVTSYAWESDGTRMATRAYAVGDGVDLGTPIAVAEDPTIYDRGWPLLERDTSYSSDGTTDNLLGHAQADQRAGRTPALAIRMQVRGDIPPTAAAIDRGDDGRLIVRPDPFHRRGVEMPVRVLGLDYAPSTSAERVGITVAPLLDTVA